MNENLFISIGFPIGIVNDDGNDINFVIEIDGIKQEYSGILNYAIWQLFLGGNTLSNTVNNVMNDFNCDQDTVYRVISGLIEEALIVEVCEDNLKYIFELLFSKKIYRLGLGLGLDNSNFTIYNGDSVVVNEEEFLFWSEANGNVSFVDILTKLFNKHRLENEDYMFGLDVLLSLYTQGLVYIV